MRNINGLVVKVVAWIFGIFIIVWTVFPIYWAINVSLMNEIDVLMKPALYVPIRPTIESYWIIFNIKEAMVGARPGSTFFIPQAAASILPTLTNSLIVAITVMIINIVFGPIASHIFYTVKFSKSNILFWIIVLTRLMPLVALLLPIFVIFKILNLFNSLLGLVLIYSALTLPISIWISYINFEGFPTECEEAALVDGYSRLEIYYKIAFPLIKPIIATVALFSFIFAYGEFFLAMLLTSSDVARTLPVIISSIVGTYHALPSMVMATVVIGMAPPLIVFILARKYVIRGIIYYTGQR
jgi:multiple sugar transport system permease protein